MRESRKILHAPSIRRHRHLRARAGVRRPRDGGQRAVRASAVAGRGGRAARRRARRAARRRRRRPPDAARGAPASTRCSSGGCARTRRRRARSTSGSPATTCARARRSTRCRWPSSCSTPDRSSVRAGLRLGLPSRSASGRHGLALLHAVDADTGARPASPGRSARSTPRTSRARARCRARGEVAEPDRRDGDEGEVEEVDVVSARSAARRTPVGSLR